MVARFRVVLLRSLTLLIVLGVAGAVAGFALAYPVSHLDLATDDSVKLDQLGLVGTFELDDALVTLEDLPKGWAAGDEQVASFSMIGSPVCGQTPVIGDQVGAKRSVVFQNASSGAYLLSEAIRVRSAPAANDYLAELTSAFDGCKAFYREVAGVATRVEIRDGQPNPPVSDYLSRTLVPVKGGVVQRLVVFWVGDVIISLQYGGSTTPPRPLLEKVQRTLLARTAPKAFGRRQKVSGEREIPEDSATSTTTSTLPPTTTAAPTTTQARRRTTTTRPATTAPPATAAPDAGTN